MKKNKTIKKRKEKEKKRDTEYNLKFDFIEKVMSWFRMELLSELVVTCYQIKQLTNEKINWTITIYNNICLSHTINHKKNNEWENSKRIPKI